MRLTADGHTVEITPQTIIGHVTGDPDADRFETHHPLDVDGGIVIALEYLLDMAATRHHQEAS